MRCWTSGVPNRPRPCAAKAAVNAGLTPLTEAAGRVPDSPSADRLELARRVRAFLHRNDDG